MTETLRTLLSGLSEETTRTVERHRDLFDPSLSIVPIPFFGHLPTARAVTIGLNPSDGELRNRSWPSSLTNDELYERLIHYFEDRRVPPHPWFSTWEQALQEIGVSYRDGSAAHIDLSSWPTRPLSTFIDAEPFLSLLEECIPVFSSTLAEAIDAKLFMMAGAVTKKYYMNEYVIRLQHLTDFTISGKTSRGGSAFVSRHSLRLAGKDLPLFFCSVSPSSRTKELLPVRIRENADELRRYLK